MICAYRYDTPKKNLLDKDKDKELVKKANDREESISFTPPLKMIKSLHLGGSGIQLSGQSSNSSPNEYTNAPEWMVSTREWSWDYYYGELRGESLLDFTLVESQRSGKQSQVISGVEVKTS